MSVTNIVRAVVKPGSDLTDSVTMLTKEGFELKHEVFLHEAPQTEPEEVSEE